MFCCRQKTAYGMRISNWRSDVCSSDLATTHAAGSGAAHVIRILLAEDQAMVRGALLALLGLESDIEVLGAAADGAIDWREHLAEIGRAHVCTPVTNAPLVCRLILENHKHKTNKPTHQLPTKKHTSHTHRHYTK